LKQNLKPQIGRNKESVKIPDDVLLNDVKKYPDACHYERARRLNYSKTGIHHALKPLSFSQKISLTHLKACTIDLLQKS